MRLTCPNCSARYEVADSMIPPEGRDVQCSNCSTTWFQPGRRTDVAPAVRVERPAPEVPEAARAASDRAATEVSEPPAPPA
uniref:zinc-ribbon domain-containing protein n=1 Tax=Roseicyclus amphidinii TaxID=3034232 RepID=UPI0024E1033E